MVRLDSEGRRRAVVGRRPVVAEQSVVVGRVTTGWIAAGAAIGFRLRRRGGRMQHACIVFGRPYSSQLGKPVARCWSIQISMVGGEAMQSDEQGKV